MSITNTIAALEKRGFVVSHFATAKEATDYLKSQIKNETVGFGGSITLKELGVYEALEENNKVMWHWVEPAERDSYAEFTTYLTSANAISQTGEIVNIDGNGNRLSASLYGPKKLYFICGTNKITEDLTSAIDRARNVAAPLNAKRLNTETPCVKGEKCFDCNAPRRICRAMVIHMAPMSSTKFTEVVLIDEVLGY